MWSRGGRSQAVAPAGEPRRSHNFTGDRVPDNVRASYPPATYAQLQAVKDQYDPFNLFRFNTNIQPTK
jgi:hypothetical protein